MSFPAASAASLGAPRAVPAAGLFVTILVLLGACGARRTFLPDPGPYDRLSEGVAPTVRRARAEAEAGRLREAWALVDRLASEHPRHVPIAILRQDLLLDLFEAGEGAPGLPPLPPPRDPADPDPFGRVVEHVFRLYRDRASADPSPQAWVLAARLAPTAAEAHELLENAARLDPQCVWVPYGRAWNFYGQREFARAREALRQALRRDGGHAPTLRLYATLLANAGEVGEALGALESWLRRAPDDPFVGRRAQAEAQVDHAALLVLDGEPEEALEVLEEVASGALPSQARAELVRAVAYAESGRSGEAMQAARRAGLLDSSGLLPLVQQAILWRNRPGGAQEERAIWERVLAEIAQEGPSPAEPGSEAPSVDFGALLIQLQANARLARLPAAPEGEP